jgi:hypothetical protein
MEEKILDSGKKHKINGMGYLCASLLIVANVVYKKIGHPLSRGYEKGAEIGTCATIKGEKNKA